MFAEISKCKIKYSNFQLQRQGVFTTPTVIYVPDNTDKDSIGGKVCALASGPSSPGFDS